MTSNLQSTELCRVRAITAFTVLPRDTAQWHGILAEAKAQCDTLAAACQAQGYTVQSVRIVSNPFGEYLDTGSLHAAAQGLAEIRRILNELNQNGLRIRFAVGEARTDAEIALLPGLIAEYGDLCNACVNVPIDENGFLDNDLIRKSVAVVQEIARITPRGEGNFNFTVNFNCASYIPYFPAGYHRGERGNAIVFGLETPDLLAAALRGLEKQPAPHAAQMQAAFTAMKNALQYHIDRVQSIIAATPLAEGWTYIGMDTSAAPSKNCTSMAELYRLLGVPYFGASGTVEVSALLTRVFKAQENVQLQGFSGLMLAVTEDEGLAAATRAAQFDIRALLTYSSVCGIGLDTVPIPGDTDAEKIAAIMRDTGTMAFRLNKPLTVRLFPVPGLGAGDITPFESDDLCNCAVLAVP
ncbi:Uncharacterized conserved protein [Kingella denitrificans]|uniref:DUF711 family protein n=1 Tax=Kingella denitrificans ATCC 33394 TaxID=888741 RepID=F0EX97_9NEIS|nr:DUF711 family protein [Kingella denitrificans]EGC18325.1 hypothetical protein HMPREF9098_0474 [Kingella denitrificans ATCC 33394]QQB41234.1 DUF711 family protein [Kingella denitrificans]STR12969.1 Uncharacterized conserved protein [Kingella denitrificans]